MQCSSDLLCVAVEREREKKACQSPPGGQRPLPQPTNHMAGPDQVHHVSDKRKQHYYHQWTEIGNSEIGNSKQEIKKHGFGGTQVQFMWQ
ncbi:hypothetical protein QQF64_011602 [Cirrhinus molitorella]|uniref:Uncharacterized protein n=1 Tax=Cirrhinus molitorella TaxID=172907 RepID=A0ABR3LZT4_9TELE